MGRPMIKYLVCVFALGALAACGSSAGLRDLSTDSAGPDEFAVIPQRALDIPETLTLPVPTPGGVNKADPNPLGDAIAALGGSQAAGVAGGIPAADAALVAQVGRIGVTPNIRTLLAQEDAQFRRTRGALSGWNPFGGDRYFAAYAAQALDAYEELARFRNLGVATPTAPPLQ